MNGLKVVFNVMITNLGAWFSVCEGNEMENRKVSSKSLFSYVINPPPAFLNFKYVITKCV